MSNIAQHAAPDETADHVAPRSKATTPAVQLERVVEVTCDPADLPVHQHVDRRMLGHGAGVLSLAGGREHEELLLSGSKDCTCRLWDLEAGQCVRTIVAHSDAVRSAKFSLDDRLVFTAGDHCVRRHPAPPLLTGRTLLACCMSYHSGRGGCSVSRRCRA